MVILVWALLRRVGKKRAGRKRSGPGGGLVTGARMDKRREDNEAAHGVVTRGRGRAGQRRCRRRLSCFCDIERLLKFGCRIREHDNNDYLSW